MDLNDGKRMFGDIKSKLGFGRKDDYEEYYDDYEEYDEEDYGEYGYDESYERSSSSSSSRYDPYSSVTTREVGSRSTGRSSMPRLVSIDDVRARTQVPSLGERESVSSSRRTSGSNSFRTMVDSSLPPQMTPEGTAAASAAASATHAARSEGLNSLFEPTAPASSSEERAGSTRSSFGAAGTSRTAPSRTLKVIKPMAYNDAEAISTALKLGDAVVLCLTGTPDALAKRILDFSFGVASALDANVESVGNKVFALTRVNELSEGERSYLRSQGLA
ncbi:cell division protein SepF [Adlercreutzia sp. R21]|uniref:Cell division protein SepF n=1 Tax=Adlercreutzia wanghongyangiae TaxID=3111451 RepID=A0ABU6IIV2_9ACTN|nr:cell division protein SepF [Adlercreutzia sp. R21]MEC4176397.1 cell division protein SepF [Adlercreutzia sp. R7]MEC4184629.1 cell division protein SepF [Adlercreutzia sp. R21]